MRTREEWAGDFLRVRRVLISSALLTAFGGCSGASPNDGASATADTASTETHTADASAASAGADGAATRDAASAPAGSHTSTTPTGDAGAGRGGISDAATTPVAVGDARTDGGTASSPGSTADAGGSAGADDCVEDPGAASTAPVSGRASGNGQVFFYAPTGNPFVRLRTKMIVPKPPKTNGVLFLWPGLEPTQGGRNYNPIGTGVLQPVLTWGGSCAPNHLGDSYDSWWISAQYVNTLGNAQGFTGCHGGKSMKVAIGDVLDIDMVLSGTSWKQTVTDEQTGKTVDFDFDLKGQDQNMGIFIIEDTYVEPSEDLIFHSSVLTYASPAPAACAIGTRGANDYVATPRPLKGGLECCIPRIVLRAKGVPASSPN